jgi:predicted nucleotidyltransferase
MMKVYLIVRNGAQGILVEKNNRSLGMDEMDPFTEKIAKELKKRISSKYLLHQFIIFGSSARGDSRMGSDIDVWVCLPELNRDIEENLFDIAYDLELEYDCLIDLIAVSEQDLNGKIGQAPIRENILSEGIAL